MRNVLMSAVLAASLLASTAGLAFAGSPNHTAPGTPGEKNCVGQTMAFLAQAGKEALDAPGIGNLAAAAGLSVQEVKEIVEAFCAGS